MREPEGDLVPEYVAIRRGLEYRKDAQGHVSQAQQPHPFLIDLLCDRGIITGDHRFFGEQLIAMRRVLNDPVRARVGMLRVRHDDPSPDKPIFMDDTDYLKVLREMRTARWREIVMAVCMEDASMSLAAQIPVQQFGLAFDQLAGAVRMLWERKRQIREADKNIDDERFR